jgi:hypothetical protein
VVQAQLSYPCIVHVYEGDRSSGPCHLDHMAHPCKDHNRL